MSTISETVVHALREQALRTPERIALTFLPAGGEALHVTCAALDAGAASIARGLRGHIQPGDRALLLYPAGLEFVEAFFAVLYLGAVAVPVPVPHRANRESSAIPKLLASAQPAAVLTSRELLERTSEGLMRAGSALVPLATDQLRDETHAADLPLPDPQSLAVLQYTSGSTSAPRGVMIAHADIARNAALIVRTSELDAASVWVSWLPHFHDLGLFGGICTPICGGFRAVLLPPMTVVNQPLRWLEAISDHRGTMSVAPNFAYDLCVRRIGVEECSGLDLSSWRVAGCAAEPIHLDTLHAFAERFARNGFRPESQTPYYGLAEATLLVSGGAVGAGQGSLELSPAALREHRIEPPRPEERAALIPSCGSPAPGFEVAIVEPEACRRRSADEIGEIWLAGPTIGRGYWNQPEETERVFGARLEDGTGPFLRTGDLGFVRDGSLYVTGRLKDLMIIRGQNIYPQDLELTARGAVPEGHVAVAFSVEAEDTERAVLVVEQPRKPACDPARALEAIREAIWSHHGLELERIVLTTRGAIPRTTSGKLQRSRARQALLEGTLPVLAEWCAQFEEREACAGPAGAAELGGRALGLLLAFAEQTPSQQLASVEDHLAACVCELLGCARTELDGAKSLMSLGASSLAMVRLKRRLEADFMIQLEAQRLWQHASLAELAAYLRESILSSPLFTHRGTVQQLVADVLSMSDQEVASRLAAGSADTDVARQHERLSAND